MVGMAMGFRVDPTRDPLEGAVRAAARQVDAAARTLRAALRAADVAGSAAAVHEARKALRRARSLVELLRPWWGREDAGDLTALLRDARRRLAGARDATVVVAALRDAARGREGPALAPEAVAALRARLQGSRDAELARLDAAAVPPVLALLSDARPALRAAAERAAAQGQAADAGEALGRGLARLHRRARAASTEALAAPDVDRLHRARRRWKEVGYVVAWWSPAWPRALKAWLDDLDEVLDLLGRDHDQAVLRERIGSWRDVAIDDAGMAVPGGPPAPDAATGPALAPGSVAAAVARSEHRSARLRGRALPRLARLTAEPTGAFVARHVAYLRSASAAARDRSAP